jgi:transposase
MRNSQKHLYLIAMQFLDFLRNFVKQAVLDAERSGRPSKLNDKKLMDISDSMLRSASKSLCKLAQEKDIGVATAHKAVREKLNLFSNKIEN